MARLFPKIEPSEIENPGERKVAEALVSQLPTGVEVFHSFNWMKTNDEGVIREGECDFVVIDPANGILFVEVKGGTLEYDTRLSEWVRCVAGAPPERLKKDPFAQAQKSMYEIIKRIEVNFNTQDNDLPFSYGYAVAFPDCRYTGSLPPSIMPDLVLDATKCQDLGTSLPIVFERFRHKTNPALSSRTIQNIHDALLPRYALIPVIWRKVEDQEERLHRLTNEQQFLLKFMQQHSKAAIQGVAGSGKTILALAKAQENAKSGLRTLFLCFNRPLKEWLISAVTDEFGDNLVINNYHGLVHDLCRTAGMSIWDNADTEDAEFWNTEAPEHLMEACDKVGDEHKFDSVIVDEGQDFRELWWTSLDGVFRDPNAKSCYYVFYDPDQNIYVENPVIPEELGMSFELPVNCRNTVKIAEHCASLVGRMNPAREGAPIGDDPESLNARTVADGFKKAGKQVRKWCMSSSGGLKNSQVAVLAPGETKSDWPEDFGGVAVTTDFEEWRKGKGVLISSWGRFKGLEADAVIIIEPNGDVTDTQRYVARSRAKHLLVVIHVHEE